MKHMIPSILCGICALLIASCGDSTNDVSTDTKALQSEHVETEITTLDSLDPTLDFGGETVTFIVDQDMYIPDFNAEQTGDIVEDALYKRRLAVQERLNVVLDFFWSPGMYANREEYQSYVRNSVMAGDSAYDIAAAYSLSIIQLGTDGYLLNIANLPYIDLSQPWWSDTLIDNLSCDGNLYFITGDISTNTIGTSFSVFFNKDLVASYQLENPYELVDSGKWTIEKMFDMTKDIYQDLNENGQRDQTDLYGLHAQNTSFDNLYFSAGMNIVVSDKEHGMTVSPDYSSEKMADLVTMLCNAFNHTDGIHWGIEDNREVVTNFVNENVVFLMSGMDVASTNLRSVDFDYGIVPTPKWDEAQKDYISTCTYTSAFFGIPLDVTNPEMSAAVIEVMAIEGYYNVAPAFFETALKVKYSTDDDSARMFDIIRASTSYDFGRVFSSAALNGIPGTMRSMITGDNANWMSTYESKIKQLDELIVKLVENLSGDES
ncbi:MAG: hypothetical protein IJW77_02250 [Clostridia bacterium]|nr:hypothetical protein [Clostridia bacterium]